uniref:Uncharacterized protein n=1 Tax=Globodera rostochiensis TaxID=31243 RepID=A0A914GT78_GLORO
MSILRSGRHILHFYPKLPIVKNLQARTPTPPKKRDNAVSDPQHAVLTSAPDFPPPPRDTTRPLDPVPTSEQPKPRLAHVPAGTFLQLLGRGELVECSEYKVGRYLCQNDRAKMARRQNGRVKMARRQNGGAKMARRQNDRAKWHGAKMAALKWHGAKTAALKWHGAKTAALKWHGAKTTAQKWHGAKTTALNGTAPKRPR